MVHSITKKLQEWIFACVNSLLSHVQKVTSWSGTGKKKSLKWLGLVRLEKELLLWQSIQVVSIYLLLLEINSWWWISCQTQYKSITTSQWKVAVRFVSAMVVTCSRLELESRHTSTTFTLPNALLIWCVVAIMVESWISTGSRMILALLIAVVWARFTSMTWKSSVRINLVSKRMISKDLRHASIVLSMCPPWRLKTRMTKSRQPPHKLLPITTVL